MQRPFREERKRRFSEMEQVYCGPEEFMEAGVRGFLITTQPDKEEFALDDSIDLLRQASIMLYGGYKTKTKKSPGHRRYVKIDFMDPGDVLLIPTPEDEPETEDEAEEEEKKDNKEKTETEEDKGEDEDEDKEKTEDEGDGETEQGEGDKKGSDAKKSKMDSDKQESDDKPQLTYMKCKHKFKAFRTELRSTLFIKSDIPDPLELASAAMDLVLKRRSVSGDSLIQLLPVQGVCNYDFVQLEIMTRRVLKSVFDESLPAKSFNVMLFDKIAEPGAEQLAETVRNTIWCMNPSCWLTSPLTEPDALIRVELIGSKLIICYMTSFMMYRQYSPSLLSALGPGCPEDDDGTDMNAEMKREHDEFLKRQQEAIERRKKEEEDRKKFNLEKRQKDLERHKEKVEAKKKREEERLKKEAEQKKRREERKKEAAEKKRLQEEKEKAEAEAKEKGEDEETKAGDEEEKPAEGADDSQDLDGSQNQSLDESGLSQDAEMASDDEEDKPKSASKKGRGRGRGKGKAKGKK